MQEIDAAIIEEGREKERAKDTPRQLDVKNEERTRFRFVLDRFLSVSREREIQECCLIIMSYQSTENISTKLLLLLLCVCEGINIGAEKEIIYVCSRSNRFPPKASVSNVYWFSI
jgi:hypothetical protein